MAQKYPSFYEDAKDLLRDVLERGKRVSFSVFNQAVPAPCEVLFSNVEDTEDSENITEYANIRLNLMTNMPVFGTPITSFVEKQRRFLLLNASGDDYWTPRMVNLIWEGDKPSTIAIDIDTREVFFVYVRSAQLDFCKFAYLTESEFEIVNTDLDDSSPFSIRLGDSAMYDYIDGAEGVNCLVSSLYICFNASAPLHIRSKGREEV